MLIQRIKILLLFMLSLSCAVAQNVEIDKTGILLVHYGTANDISRYITIDKLNKRVAEQFSDCSVVEAYAAPTVIKILAKKNIKKLTIAQGLDSLKALGCTNLVVQSSMLLDGVMMDILKGEVTKVRNNFKTVNVAYPLLYSVNDCRQMVEMINKNLLSDKNLDVKNSQVVLVGHGSDSPANAMYSQIDYLLKDEGKSTWHVGTIEGYPTIDNVERQLDKIENKKVILVPLLYIAGNHQREDIDGHWKDELQKKGYNVTVLGKGLGEMPEIQELILNKISDNINNK